MAVETGVANGFSTAFALLALDKNGTGHLHSVDLPREVGRDYEDGAFYEGEGRAGIPSGSEPGWLIPADLKERWTLVLGRTQDELPPLLERLGTIDSFMHDSEHSFDCMWFEFNEAWPHLRAGRPPAVGRRQLDGGVSALRAGAGPPSRFAWPGGWRSFRSDLTS